MTTLTLGRWNGRALARTVLLVCAVAVLGLAVGRVSISHYGLAAVEVLGALAILFVLLPRPYAACVLLLVLLCSVPFYTWLPRANIPGRPPINIGDILLVATVGGALWRRPWRRWPTAVRRFQIALALMLLLALIPTIVSALHGHDAAREALDGYKDLLFISVGLTVALELSGRVWWPVVNTAVVLAAAVAFLSILAAASGSIGQLLTSFDASAVVNATADLTVGTTSRIRLPGLFFVYAMTLPTLVMVLLIKDKWRWMRLGALLLMIGAIAVSLNRNMYLGGAAGLLVTLLVGGPRLRYRVLVVAATAGAIIAIVVQSTVAPAVTAEVAARAQSALTTSVLQTSSLTDRRDEFAHAFTSIAQHPWTGVGWYQAYGSMVNDAPRLYVEDWYLHVATDLGIPVALAFLVVVTVLLGYGIRQGRRATRTLDRAMVAAGVGSLVALLLSCLVGTYLQDPNSMTAFGFTCGVVLVTGLRADPISGGREVADQRSDDGAIRCG